MRGAASGQAGWVLERYSDLASRVLATPANLGPVRLVAIDGPAGAGKTTFASRLGRELRGKGASVDIIHTDDFLDGWADMVTFWPRLEEWVFVPLRHGRPGRYRRYDWTVGRFETQWHPVPVPDVLIVEGVTSARAVIRPELCLSVVLDADARLRLARALERDGEGLRDELVRWMVAEQRHFAADDTVRHADLLVNGAPTALHDPERDYVRARGVA